jgi:hypothetical protein
MMRAAPDMDARHLMVAVATDDAQGIIVGIEHDGRARRGGCGCAEHRDDRGCETEIF